MITKPIVLIISALIIVVAGYMVYTNYAGRTSTPAVTTTPEKKVPFATLLGQGGSYQCTVHQDVANTSSTGIVFFSDGKLRADFNTTAQGMKITTSLLVRDQKTYTWSSMMPNRGFITPTPKPLTTNSGAPASGTFGFDATQIGDYDCQPWTPDVTKFNIPLTITFSELKTQ